MQGVKTGMGCVIGWEGMGASDWLRWNSGRRTLGGLDRSWDGGLDEVGEMESSPGQNLRR